MGIRQKHNRNCDLELWKSKERGKTYIYAHIGVFVDRRWEEQEISRFTGLLELRTQPGDDLLGGESLEGLGGGHSPLFESSSGIVVGAGGDRSDGSGAGCYCLWIGGGSSKTEHELNQRSRAQHTYHPRCKILSFLC